MSGRYLIIVARFNDMVTRALLEGAQSTFRDHDVKDESVDILWVPGCFEIPVVAGKAARSKVYDAIVCIGAVIRGDTPHFDHVAGQAASGIMKISVDTGVPVIFGVLTTDTVEQALNRAGLKLGNKGSEAAAAALSMTKVMKQLEDWSHKK